MGQKKTNDSQNLVSNVTSIILDFYILIMLNWNGCWVFEIIKYGREHCHYYKSIKYPTVN